MIDVGNNYPNVEVAGLVFVATIAIAGTVESTDIVVVVAAVGSSDAT